MRRMHSIIASTVIYFLFCNPVQTLQCTIGWGQEGREYRYAVEWSRSCHPLSRYCFKATTYNIEQAKALIAFTWDRYYRVYHFKACGGEWGTPLNVRQSVKLFVQ